MHTFELRDWRNPVTPSRDEQKRIERSYLRYAGAGVEFFASIVILTLAGVWLDAKLGSTPVLTIVLALVGFAGATWSLIRSVSRPMDPPHRSDGTR